MCVYMHFGMRELQFQCVCCVVVLHLAYIYIGKQESSVYVLDHQNLTHNSCVCGCL